MKGDRRHAFLQGLNSSLFILSFSWPLSFLCSFEPCSTNLCLLDSLKRISPPVHHDLDRYVTLIKRTKAVRNKMLSGWPFLRRGHRAWLVWVLTAESSHTTYTQMAHRQVFSFMNLINPGASVCGLSEGSFERCRGWMNGALLAGPAALGLVSGRRYDWV